MRFFQLLVLALPAISLGQPLAEVGHFGENIGTVDVDQDRGIVNEGTHLRMIDVTTPSTPEFRGVLDLGFVPSGAFVVGDKAYVPSPTGPFAIVDLSDLDAPNLLASEDWEAWKHSVWVRRVEDYAYVGTCETVDILDVSSPSDPVRVGNLGPLGACVEAITGDGGYLYVVTDGPTARLRIYSLIDPANPVLIGSEPGNNVYSRWPGNIAVFGDQLYLGQTDGNYVYDIADRTDPRLVERMTPSGYFEDTFDIDRGMLHVAGGEKLDIWSLSDPSAPTLETTSFTGVFHQTRQVAAFQGRSLAARTHGLTLTDTASGNSSNVLSPTPNVGWAGTLEEREGTLYMGTGPGIAVVSLTNPTAPAMVRHVSTRWSADLKTEGTNLYNLSAWGWLEVYSISSATNPTLQAEYPVPGGLDTLRLDVTPERAAITGNNEVIFYSRTVNGDLTERSRRSLPVNANAVALSGSHAFVASGNGELRVYEISNLSNPQLLRTLPVLGGGEVGFNVDAEVEGNRLHILFGKRGYALIDIGSPSNPSILDTFPTFEMEGASIAPEGNVVYLATFGWNGRRGVRALDVSTPSNITLSATARATSLVRDVIATSGYVYTAESQGALRVRNPVEPVTTGDRDRFGGFIIH